MIRTYNLLLTKGNQNVFEKFKINKDATSFQLWLKKTDDFTFVTNGEPTHVELKLKHDEFEIKKIEIINPYVLFLQVMVDEDTKDNLDQNIDFSSIKFLPLDVKEKIQSRPQ